MALGDEAYDAARIARWFQWSTLRHLPRELQDLQARMQARRAQLQQQFQGASMVPDVDAAVREIIDREFDGEVSAFNKRTREAERRCFLGKNSIYRDIRAALPGQDLHQRGTRRADSGVPPQDMPFFDKMRYDSILLEEAETEEILRRVARERGFTVDEVRGIYERQRELDWSHAPKDETSRVLRGSGHIIVRPDQWLHEEDYRAAVAASGGTEEATRAALAQYPQLRRQAVEQMSAHVNQTWHYQRWRDRQAAGNPAFLRQSTTDQAVQYLDQLTTADRLELALTAGLAEGVMNFGQGVFGTGAMLGIPGAQGLVDRGSEAMRLQQEYVQGAELDRGLTFMGLNPRNVTSTLVTMAPAVMSAGFTGSLTVPSLLSGMQSTGGTYAEVYADAISRGLSPDEARAAATQPALISGVVTTGLTALGGKYGPEGLALGLSNPATRQVIARTLRGRVVDALKQGGASFLVHGAAEGLEESLDTFLSELGRHWAYEKQLNPHATLDWEALAQKVRQSATMGAFLGGSMGGSKGLLEGFFRSSAGPASGSPQSSVSGAGSASPPPLPAPASGTSPLAQGPVAGSQTGASASAGGSSSSPPGGSSGVAPSSQAAAPDGLPPGDAPGATRPRRPSDDTGPTWRGIGDRGQIVVLPASAASSVQEAMSRLQGMLADGQTLLPNFRLPRTPAEAAEARQDARLTKKQWEAKVMPLMLSVPVGPLRHAINRATREYDPASELGVESFVKERLIHHLVKTGMVQPGTLAGPAAGRAPSLAASGAFQQGKTVPPQPDVAALGGSAPQGSSQVLPIKNTPSYVTSHHPIAHGTSQQRPGQQVQPPADAEIRASSTGLAQPISPRPAQHWLALVNPRTDRSNTDAGVVRPLSPRSLPPAYDPTLAAGSLALPPEADLVGAAAATPASLSADASYAPASFDSSDAQGSAGMGGGVSTVQGASLSPPPTASLGGSVPPSGQQEGPNHPRIPPSRVATTATGNAGSSNGSLAGPSGPQAASGGRGSDAGSDGGDPSSVGARTDLPESVAAGVPGQRIRSRRPNPKKWRKRGGRIINHRDGRVTYIDWEGNRVTYTGNFPDFKAAGLVRQEVKISMKGNYTTDLADAEATAPLGPKLKTNSWHHHEDGTTMQEIDQEIHARFTHDGGVSKKKRENL